jgi:AcrR family transcriptional regulator
MPVRKRHKPLDQDRILDMAQACIADLGLDGWSMRGLAAQLKVEPMSLYHWFPSRGHVLDGLLDRFAAKLTIPTTGTWDERLAGLARNFRDAALEVPAFFPYIAVHRFNTLVTLDRLEALLAFFALEFPDPKCRAAAFRLFVHWLTGFLLDATSGFTKGPSAADPPPDELVAERFPTVVALGPFNRTESHDELFEIGLRAILAAIRELRH